MTRKGLPTLETARLTLRPFALSDAVRVQELAGHPEVALKTSLIPHPYPAGAAEKWIESHTADFLEGRGVNFAIVPAETGALIGAIALGISALHRRAEMGYWIGVPFWGKGFCTEAAKAVIRYGLLDLGLNKITAGHYASNPASGHVMTKAGLKYEGTLKSHVCRDGVFHDLPVYGLTRADFMETRNA